MKNIWRIAMVFLFCVGGYWQHSFAQSKFEDLRKYFNHIPNQYRTVPFWSWNYKVTKSEIDRMLLDFKDKGFGGVFVHPRYGMVTEYLSDEWFELYEYTIQQGEKLGLDIWLYDENAYPSGFAGGLLPAQFPQSYTQGQGLQPVVVKMLPENYKQYSVILMGKNDQYKDITDSAFCYMNKKGDYYLYKKTYYLENVQPSRAWYAGFCYTDLLMPGVTDKFIEITMSGYERNFVSRFGKNLKGVFSDEINIRSSGGFRWTPDLFDVFDSKYGYDLKQHLPSLHLPVGNWKKIRYDYNKLLLELFIERWAKPWYRYCTDHNLIWTGHYWEQTWPDIEQVPDNMAMNAWQQMPGIDMLSNSFDDQATSAMFGNVRVVKEAKSVANQMGRKRLLCETYGGGGWNMSFKDMKRYSDWLNVMGVNFINQHLSPMSFLGVRKYDWPPMFCSMAPWWDDYKILNEYLARMSTALTLGQEKNNILVFEPTSTTWMYAQHIGNDGNKKAKEIGNAFQSFVTNLSKHQVEYDLGCENIIASHAKIVSNKFVVGQCSYSTVVIPEYVENMDSVCFSLLQTFVEQGGKLISFSIPDRIDGKKSRQIVNLFQNEQVIHFNSVKDCDLISLLASPSILFVLQKGGNLYHHRRKYEDGELLLLVNSSSSEKTFFTIEMEGNSVVELDNFSGKTHMFPFEKREKRLSFSGEIEPVGSLMLFISQQSLPIMTKAPKRFIKKELIKDEEQLKIKRLRDNVLIVDHLDLLQKDSTWKQQYFMDANFEVYRRAGFKNGNPWFRAVQFKQEIINRDVSKAPGFRVIYSFKIMDNLMDFSSLKLLCERASLYEVRINGHILQSKGVPFMDKDFTLFPIGTYLHAGLNEVEFSLDHFNVEAEIEPIYILGDFTVIKNNNKWVIGRSENCSTLGPIKEKGAPFYPWEMCYIKTYNIYDKQDFYYISVPKWKGSVVQVWVNDQKAGILFTAPYHLDITDLINNGKNKVEVRVVGGMDNFFGPHYSRTKELTPPWDWQKHDGNDQAEKYILTDYGLLEDFELFHAKFE